MARNFHVKFYTLIPRFQLYFRAKMRSSGVELPGHIHAACHATCSHSADIL